MNGAINATLMNETPEHSSVWTSESEKTWESIYKQSDRSAVARYSIFIIFAKDEARPKL